MIPSTSFQLLKLKLPLKILDVEEKFHSLQLNKNKQQNLHKLKLSIFKDPKESITKKLLNNFFKKKNIASNKKLC